jgi:hypothetical protein
MHERDRKDPSCWEKKERRRKWRKEGEEEDKEEKKLGNNTPFSLP